MHQAQLNTNSTHFRRNWVGFFLLGLSNMLPYAMVSAAANSIARSYHKEGFVATVYGAAGSTTIVVKLLNTFVLTRVSYNIRFTTNTLVLLLGIAGVAYAPTFITAIFAVVIVGASYAFGENLALGYLSKFDSRLVNAWSSGCGCAGLISALFVIAAGCLIKPTLDKASDLKEVDWYSFLACCPFVFLYLIAYLMVIVEAPGESALHQVNGYSVNAAHVTDDDPSTEQDSLLGHEQSLSQGEPRRLTMSDRWHCFKLIWKLGVNAAQFASLSSVQHIKIRRVHVLAAIQFINAVIWIVNTVYKFMPVYILPAYMVIIGLIMGAIYVNTFYMVHNDDIFPTEHRDLLANMTGTFLTVGVSLCSILMTVLYKTVLVNY
ncbi:battenin-like isoform X2 [Lytechinus variegatus]|uniref:battenin-like isoform X2 n=1 Tax=Lytechinus variegatus TaxID=7654 RepID=UPI001BB1393B|nr:battenin-like isoform X2 [Lytechinus variegatus]